MNAPELAAAVSVAHRALPDVPSGLAPDAVSICLMYQYKEPAWTRKQVKAALAKITTLASVHEVTGRGRLAPEGLNCTLTGSAAGLREFCYALRRWDPLFQSTDFKLTDGLPTTARFRIFGLRKVEELVNYGLQGPKAPSVTAHGGVHLEAHEYHEAMKDEGTVIIDVRNAYESAIGHFQPPPGGATLLDPRMRNSSDFPKWLNAPETRAQLQGKKVMMYCTGGIRCERATALLNQMTQASNGSFATKDDVVMVRGGIERYIKTFPGGGFWKGKNYLFDRRMEQVPAAKPWEDLKADMESCCVLCRCPYAVYRGQHKCSTCVSSVPVLVCSKKACQRRAKEEPAALVCPLCEAGYEAPTAAPDLLGQKRKLGIIDGNKDRVSGVVVMASSSSSAASSSSSSSPAAASSSSARAAPRAAAAPSKRLFVGRLPLLLTATRLRASLRALLLLAGSSAADAADAAAADDDDDDDVAFLEDTAVVWVTNRNTGAYYGSAFVGLARLEDARRLVAAAAEAGGMLLVEGQQQQGQQQGQQQEQQEQQEQQQCSGAEGPPGAAATAGEAPPPPAKKRQKRRGQATRRARVCFAPLHDGVTWPPTGHEEAEYPPLGHGGGHGGGHGNGGGGGGGGSAAA